MNYVLTIHLKAGVQEIFLPSVQNRAVSIEIDSGITNNHIAASLSLDVFDGVWTIRPNAHVLFDIPLTLSEGLRINARLVRCKEDIVIFVEELDLGRTKFDQFYVAPGVPITIGASKNNIIRYNTKELVSSRHLYIEPSPAGATLVDTSRNGSFVNGKRVHERQTLQYGDTISIFGLKVIWLDDLLAINRPKEGREIAGLVGVDSAQAAGRDPEPSSTDEYYARSPRRMPKLDEESVEIDAPPAPSQERRQSIWMTIGPSITMVIPMAVGLIFTMMSAQGTGGETSAFMFMGIFTSVTAAIIGVFWALLNVRQQKKQELEVEQNRQKRYGEYLDRIEREISEKHAKNRTALCEGYPNIGICLRWVVTQDRHLWERNINHADFLKVRLGMGAVPTLNPVEVPKTKFSLADDSIAERPFDIQKKYEMLTNVPICLSIFENHLIGVIGDDRRAIREMARIFAAQVALVHSYTDVKMVFIVPPGENWEFAKWIPHCWSEDNSIRLVANDPTSVGEVLYHLSGVIRTRSDEDRQKEVNLPHYVVFIADPDLVENEAAVKRITASSQSLGFTALLFYDRLDRLPNHCTVIVQRDKEYRGFYSLENAFPAIDGVQFDSVPSQQFEEICRLMSGLKVREAEGSGAIPQMLTFLDMYKTSDTRGIDVYRNWLENRTYESMKALIGARGGGSPLYLDIHEKYHGPHGLVAGTTGSGKSEMLQTYILSLAVAYHPHEVSFIL
ncbi:MAG: FtsK/SpoIIIE domain-containing protein, partial [Clostridiales bacterium]|nr:FtsK/SpoIIIE domain-containing protein [Clostridiales bacterium]